jgi:hypothetical protein
MRKLNLLIKLSYDFVYDPFLIVSSEGCRTVQFHVLCVTGMKCYLCFVKISAVQQKDLYDANYTVQQNLTFFFFTNFSR